ncbi:MAG TPA: TolC family protein [Cytophagaceae bacterium]|nr:TolC family protein [Cytophagaceae bacterium]
MKKFHLSLILLFLFSWNGYSQKLWTLEECIVYASQNNLPLKQAENNVLAAWQNLVMNKGALLPTVNGTSSLNYNLGRTIDPFTNQYSNNHITSNNYSLNGSLTVFNGLQVQNSIRQTQASYQANKLEVERLKNELSLNVASAYLQILLNEEIFSNSQHQIEITNEQIRRTTQLSEAGKISPSLLFDLQAQLALEESQRIGAENQVQVSFLVLAQFMNLELTPELRIMKPENLTISESALPTQEEIYNSALSTQPQVKESEYNLQALRYAWDVQKGRISPRLSLNSSISTLYSSSNKVITGYDLTGSRIVGYTQTTGDAVLTPVFSPISNTKTYRHQVQDNINKFVGLTLNIPILNGLQVSTSIKRAEFSYENADLDAQITKQNIRKSVQRAYLDATLSLKQYHATMKAMEAQQQAFFNAQKRLDAGMITPFEYNQTKTKYTVSQSDLLRSKYDYLFKTKILDFYRGVPLKL